MNDLTNDRDRDLLRSIAALRVVTVSQLALLSGRTPRAVRERVGALEGLELIQGGTAPLSRGRGRPEKVLGITAQGVEVLREAGFESAAACAERQLNPRLLSHQLLITAFRAQISVMTRTWPEFQAKFLAHDAVADPAGAPARLVPDAIMSLTHTGVGKTLLFFLEADLGTETLAGGGAGNIRQKIISYQELFRSGGYKIFEAKLVAKLKGFRLLFVTDQDSRLAALCRVARETPPSDFVWLTDEASLSSPGVGGPIWCRGGRMDRPHESILGSKMPAVFPAPQACA